MPSLLLDPDEFAPSGTEGDEMTLRKLLDSYASLQSQPPEAQQAARAFSETRARLEKIEKLTDTMAESAAHEFVRYASMLAGLERRFDDLGAELGLGYLWRDAWRPKMKASQADLQFERVGALWNAAACYSYVGALAQPRGPSRGGLKEAYRPKPRDASECLEPTSTTESRSSGSLSKTSSKTPSKTRQSKYSARSRSQDSSFRTAVTKADRESLH